MAPSRRTHMRAAAFAVALIGATVLTPAEAAIKAANTSGAMTVSSATWSAIPTPSSSGTPPPGTVSIGFSRTLVLTTPPQYFYVANAGTAALSRTSYQVDGIGGALLGNPVITLKACVGGTWNTSTDVCSAGAGAVITIGTFTSAAPGPVDSATTAGATGSRLHIQASVSNFGLLGSFTAVFGTSVTSTTPRQVSGPTTTNS